MSSLQSFSPKQIFSLTFQCKQLAKRAVVSMARDPELAAPLAYQFFTHARGIRGWKSVSSEEPHLLFQLHKEAKCSL